jgi:hypothetical protein
VSFFVTHTRHDISPRLDYPLLVADVFTKKKRSQVMAAVQVRVATNRTRDGEQPTPQDTLALRFPEVASQWHPSKNAPLTSFQVRPFSNRWAWWVCSQGHEWKAKINMRARGFGCPFCSHKRASPQYNLATVQPAVAAQWHPTANGTLRPDAILPGIAKKVWWRCQSGHQWQATVNSRTTPPGRGCPHCARAILGKRMRSQALRRGSPLAQTHPDIAREWHPQKNPGLTPETVTLGSHTKVWWVCRFGHEWQATVHNRTNGRGCPLCKSSTSRIEVRFYTEMKSIFPSTTWRQRIAGMEADVLIPELSAIIEIDGYPWHAGKESKDFAKSQKLAALGYTVIRLRDRQLRPTWHHEIQIDSRATSHTRALRDCIHYMLGRINLPDTQRTRLAAYLRRRAYAAEPEFKAILSHLPAPPPAESLAATRPDLAQQWHPAKNAPLLPSMFSTFSHELVWWRCQLGHEWRAEIANCAQGRGCPACALATSGSRRRAAAVKSKGSITKTHPQLLQEWHPAKNGTLAPDQFPAQSNAFVWWRCAKGHEWQAQVAARSRGRGCPFCARALVGLKAAARALSRSGALADKFPILAAQWHPAHNEPLSPANVSPGSHASVWWQCASGHAWKAQVRARVVGTGCPHCLKLTPSSPSASIKHPPSARPRPGQMNTSVTIR